jgi:hypothetical protein
MDICDWHGFYASLVIVPGYGHLVPKPTEAQLDQFEAETGLPLPQSYRNFIKVFGPGEFPCVLLVAAPGYAQLNCRADLLSANRSYGYTPEQIADSGLPTDQRDRLLRPFYFGLERGREWLAWDPQDVRDPSAHEYGIYRVDFRQDVVELVATSFRQLVEDICEQIFAPDPDYDEESMGPQRAFQPATWVPGEDEKQAEQSASADGPRESRF